MTAAALVLFGFAAALGAWSYLVYPVLLARMARSAGPAAPPPASSAGGPPPSVDVLVSAADEEAVIGARVENLLAQEADGPYRVVIGCDGSGDTTAARAREAGGGGADRMVTVTEFPSRRGKASVLNDLVSASDADVLVFTDANTRFDPDAVRELSRAVRTEGVGAACGRLVLESAPGRPTPEGEFWDRETKLKEREGRLGTCLGANGAIYAARRAMVRRLPPDTTSMDDFLIPLGVLERGASVVFVPFAVAREGAARSVRAEAGRRFRIGVGAGQVLRRERWLWNAAKRPRLAFIFFSRKTARWLAPVAALAGAAAAVWSPTLFPAGIAFWLLAGLAAIAARSGVPARGLAGRLYYFGVINLSLACGVVAGLVGYRRPVWKPVARA